MIYTHMLVAELVSMHLNRAFHLAVEAVQIKAFASFTFMDLERLLLELSILMLYFFFLNLF
jgi:hypothetical protein